MVKSQPLKTQTSHFKIFETFDDLLEEGKSYVLLNENSLLYQNETGKYVFLTIDPKATYSADDFMKLPEGAPFELLNGKLTNMPPPKSPHQIASGNLFSALHLFVKRNKLGIVLSAPMDVHLDNKNIFQPDILFLSNDRKSLLKDWVYGVPDLTVEIISPGSKSDDLKTKFKQNIQCKFSFRSLSLVILKHLLKPFKIYCLDNIKGGFQI